MTDEEALSQRILLDDFAVANRKLEALLATAAGEALALQDIAENLERGEERGQIVALCELPANLHDSARS